MKSRWVRPLVLSLDISQLSTCTVMSRSISTNLRPASSGNRVHQSTHIWPNYYLKYDSVANQSDARNLYTYSPLQSEPVLRKVLILKEGNHSYWKRVDNLCKISRNETNFISASPNIPGRIWSSNVSLNNFWDTKLLLKLQFLSV